jgi:SRSO17 transposase
MKFDIDVYVVTKTGRVQIDAESLEEAEKQAVHYARKEEINLTKVDNMVVTYTEAFGETAIFPGI